MKPKDSAFIIVREDRAVDPVTLLTEGLTIGRLPDCELVLNHPTVSRIHAGIKEVDGQFYIFHLSPSNSTTLNSNLVEEKEALADGDLVQIGPFFLYINRDAKALSIRVVYQTAVRIGDAEILSESAQRQMPAELLQPAAKAGQQESMGGESAGAAALSVFWEKRKREAGKITRASALRPRTPPRLGKARFNWVPTRDLSRPWPVSIFTWGVLLVGLCAVAAAYSYTSAFSPAPLSNPHARSSMNLTPTIAKEPNANSCTTCHTLTASMETQCASCHQTETFDSAVIEPHAAAGIGCVACHSEHRGEDFRPGLAPLNANFQPGKVAPANTCTGCHNDANEKTYNGRRVFTPHGGTFGYPVVNDRWEWEGLSEAEWEQKPEGMRKVMAAWRTNGDPQLVLSAQFHALHIHRVRAIGGLPANPSGEMSCSSCHKTLGTNLDVVTPRQTCTQCHNGKIDRQTQQTVIGTDAPNCTSCHVQHFKDKRHWNPSLLTTPEQNVATTTTSGANSLLASSHGR